MQVVVDFVKDHLQPAWKAKRVDRDAFRLITRKVAEKVLQAAPREAKPLLQVRAMPADPACAMDREGLA